MSWNKNLAGTKAGVYQALATATDIPNAISVMLQSLVSTIQPPPACGLSLETSGHVDDVWGGNGTFKVTVLSLVLDPPVPEVEAARMPAPGPGDTTSARPS